MPKKTFRQKSRSNKNRSLKNGISKKNYLKKRVMRGGKGNDLQDFIVRLVISYTLNINSVGKGRMTNDGQSKYLIFIDENEVLKSLWYMFQVISNKVLTPYIEKTSELTDDLETSQTNIVDEKDIHTFYGFNEHTQRFKVRRIGVVYPFFDNDKDNNPIAVRPPFGYEENGDYFLRAYHAGDDYDSLKKYFRPLIEGIFNNDVNKIKQAFREYLLRISPIEKEIWLRDFINPILDANLDNAELFLEKKVFNGIFLNSKIKEDGKLVVDKTKVKINRDFTDQITMIQVTRDFKKEPSWKNLANLLRVYYRIEYERRRNNKNRNKYMEDNRYGSSAPSEKPSVQQTSSIRETLADPQEQQLAL